MAQPPAARQRRTPGGPAVLWYLLFLVLFVVSAVLLVLAGIPFLWGVIAFFLFLVFGLILFLANRGGAKPLPSLVVCGFPAVVVALALVLNGFGLLGWNPDDDGGNPSVTPGGSIGIDSSAVSVGVSLDDLGNILNGQYYFDDGSAVYYSSFDADTAAHIYRKDKKSGDVVPIFDGFGWSLVVDKGWLYFSGNAGTTIDGTYHLFRIRTDGTQLETLDSGYCFGMSFYRNWLYYIVRESDATYSIARLGLDGTNRETLVVNTFGYGIVFENRLYYMDAGGILNVSKPDGTDPRPVLPTAVSRFTIGNGGLFYVDATGAIWRSGIGGKDPKKLREPGKMPFLTLNSYKDTVFFSEYDPNPVEGRSAYRYTIGSIKADGTGEKALYEGISQSCWMNLVGGRLYVLDYAVDPATGRMPAIVREMPAVGGTPADLPRP